MKIYLQQIADSSIAIHLIENCSYDAWLDQQSPAHKTFLQNSGFKAEQGAYRLLYNADNRLTDVVLIFSAQQGKTEYIAELSLCLPEGDYHLADFADDHLVYLGWGMGAYQFTRYKKAARVPATLYLPASLVAVQYRLDAIYLVRDLINTPAVDMGPAQLADAVKQLADQFNATYVCVADQAELKKSFPAIYTVGKASTEHPRLIDLHWGEKHHPKITLIGKGVCFDSGGLNIKAGDGMRFMKKDMGGAANVLGLASYIMAANLPVALRVIIPAVENSISGNAMRPGDIITMRNGKTVEVDNTDAEGRLILADAISYATEEEQPEILFSFATLTGAARVAVGTEIAAYFATNDALANEFYTEGLKADDPVWRLPLYQPYKRSLKNPVADLQNTGYSKGGAIIAALFLEQFFVNPAHWFHLDIMAWNENVRPGHPPGGEAMGIAAAFNLIQNHLTRAQ